MLVAAREQFADLRARKLLAPGDVENSSLLFQQQLPASASGELSVNRRAELIREETQRLSPLPYEANLLVETAISRRRVAAVERGADDGVAWICENDPFGGGFGFRIDAQWIDRVSFKVVSFAPIKDEVGGKQNERDVCGQFSEQGGGLGVGLARRRRIGLAILSLAHRGAVDDGGGFFCGEQSSDG